MAKKRIFGNRDRTDSAPDGNAMGLTKAFHPIASDGFTAAMPTVGEGSSVDGAEISAGPEGVVEEIDLADGVAVDDEGLSAGESFGDEDAFDDFYAGRPVREQDAPIPDAKPLAVISESAVTKPNPKAKGAGPRHGRHASVPDGKDGASHVPEYMRKSRRMRRILIVVIVLLILLLAAMFYFGFQMLKTSDSTAVQQAQSAEQQVDAIGADDTTDAANEAVKTTTVPDLVSLLGLTQDEAVERLQHGAQVTGDPRAVNEEGNPIKSEVRVALTAEPADSRTGTPTVFLGLNKKGRVIQAGYSTSTASLGYGALSFADAVRTEHVIEKTLAEAGVTVGADEVALPEDSSSYTTYDTDGKTITKEYCSFSGSSEVDGTPHTWSAVLSYDYSMANASGNLADTVRTIFIYVNS
ncbi:histone-lysine N-methyltransferase [Eggerthellaceae bacterium 24-137]